MTGWIARFVTLTAARACGLLRRIVCHHVVAGILILVAIVGLILLAEAGPVLWPLWPLDEMFERAGAAPSKGWLTPWTILSVFAFGLVVWWTNRLRQLLVVSEFQNLGGDDTNTAKGLGALIAAELGLLRDLFDEFDEGRAIQATPERVTPVDATVHVAGVDEFLRDSVSAESSFGLGPLKIPVGVVIGLVGKLVRGPRIEGQVHVEGDQRIIAVQLLRTRNARIWNEVEPGETAPDGTVSWRSIDSLARALAAEIFAEIALGGGVRGPALAAFVEGLRAYRLSLRTGEGRKLNRKRAERMFTKAITRDQQFDLAYYNLGVVYADLNEYMAASAAFEKAISKNNRRWSAYYALAQTRFMRGRNDASSFAGRMHLLKAIDCCDRVIALSPNPAVVAQSMNLRTQAHIWLNDLRQALIWGRKAARTSWLALCHAEATRGSKTTGTLAQARQLASACLRSLSNVYLQAMRWEEATPSVRKLFRRRASALLRHAAHLTPWVTGLHYWQGIAHLRDERFHAARHALTAAVRTDPLFADGWGRLAYACAKIDKSTQAEEAYHRVLDNPSAATDDTLAGLADAMSVLLDRRKEVHDFVTGPHAHSSVAERLRCGRTLLRYAYRLTERRWWALAEAIKLLQEWLTNPGKETEDFESAQDRLSAFRSRIEGLKDFMPSGLKKLRESDDREQQLQALLAQSRAQKHHWELSVVADELARLWLQKAREARLAEQESGAPKAAGALPSAADALLANADALLETALEPLNETAPGHIGRLGLLSLRARCLSERGEYAQALPLAKEASHRYPVRAYEWETLGEVYQGLNALDQALEAWEAALLWDPDNGVLHCNIGWMYARRADDVMDKARRAALLEKAAGYLDIALELVKDGSDAMSWAHQFSSLVASRRGEHPQAISHLRILEGWRPDDLMIGLYLADALLSSENFTEARDRFGKLTRKIEERMDSGEDVNTILVSKIGNEVLGSALCWARLGAAAALSSRAILLPTALKEVEEAQAALEGVQDQVIRDHWLANCRLFRGEVLFRLDRIDDASAHIEKALVTRQDAAAYYYLAVALERKLERRAPGSDVTPLLRGAKRNSERARDLDFTGRLTRKLDSLDARLAAK